MALGFSWTDAVALAMATAALAAMDAGTAAVIEIYAGAIPTYADTTPVSPTLLASLTCSVTSAVAATNGINGRLTFNAITPDSSADATGTAAYYRIKTQTGGTTICQGNVGVGTFDLVLNTTSITAGSTVSVTSASIDVPKG